MQPFVIVTTPRSGSYHMVSLLDSAIDIRCYGEVYKGNKVELPKDCLSALSLTKTSVQKRNDLGLGFMEQVFSLNDAPIQGFKAFPDQLARSGLDDVKMHPNWKYLFLKRNPLETYVSLKRAQRTGVFVLNKGDESHSEVRHLSIEIDIPDLLARIERHEMLFKKWKKMIKQMPNGNGLVVDYRWFQFPRRLNQILNFLGSSASANDLTSHKSKQFIQPFWDGVDNSEDVLEALMERNRHDLVKDL